MSDTQNDLSTSESLLDTGSILGTSTNESSAVIDNSQTTIVTGNTDNPVISVTEPNVAVDATPPSFIDTLPDDLKAEACLKDFKDPAALAKSYVHAAKLVGKSVQIPGENATEEEINSFYTKLGRPETPEGYEVSSVLTEKTDLVNMLPGLETEVAEFSTIAHKLGLSKEAAKTLVEWQVTNAEKQMTEIRQANKEALEASRAALKDMWGTDVDANTAAANNTARALAVKYPAEMEALLHSDAARNPLVMVMLAELGNSYKEGSSYGEVNNISADAREQAQREIERIKQDPTHPYRNRSHPKHWETVNQVNKLYDIAYK